MTKVLYVEDNDDNVYMLKMRLELRGDFEGGLVAPTTTAMKSTGGYRAVRS